MTKEELENKSGTSESGKISWKQSEIPRTMQGLGATKLSVNHGMIMHSRLSTIGSTTTMIDSLSVVAYMYWRCGNHPCVRQLRTLYCRAPTRL
jgi:hypothetical protein